MNDAQLDPAAAVMRRVEYLLGSALSARWDADQQLGWAGIMEISRVLPARHNREMLAEHGLSLTLLSLLGRLEACGEATLQARDLARDMDLSPGKVSRHVSTLEAEGLVTRRHNAGDGRAMDVELTEAGRSRLAAARRTAFEIVQRDFLSPLTPEELSMLARIAIKLLRALDTAGA